MDNWNNKQKVIVQLVCILLSLGLWIYVTNIENPIKSYELNNVPVEILNSDSLKDTGLALAPNQNFYVKLKVEGNTQDLFSIDKSDFKITVDLSEFVLKKGENKIAVNIKEAPSTVKIKNSSGLTITVNTEEYSTKGPESLVNKVTKVIAEGEESNAVKTIVKDYIISAVDDNGNEVTGVQLSQKWVEATIEINEGKTVPIKINTTGTLPNGLRLKSISSDTTEIGITGPEEILNNVSEIGTEVIDLSGIKDSTTVEVALGIPDGISIHNGESSIKVNISIDKAQTKEFTISYSIVGTTAEGLTIIPDSDKVTITVSGYADVLNSLTEANFAAELDVSEYTEAGEYTKVPTVNLVGVDNVNIDSVSEVKLTISKDSQTSTNDPNTSTGNTEELNQ